MSRTIRLSTGLALAAALAACTDGPASSVAPEQPAARSAARSREAIPDQYIVRLRDDVRDVRGVARRLAADRGAGVERGGQILHVYEHTIKGFAARMTASDAEALRENDLVVSVEQDILDYIDEPADDQPTAITTQGSATWGLDRIDQRDRPVDGQYRYRANGEGVRVYIIDSGIRFTHQEFEGRASLGIDLTGAPADSLGVDCTGHGSHVAGTVAGKTFGVAKKAEIVVVRTFRCPSATGVAPTSPRSRTIAAVDWVTANAVLPAVANMSLGGTNEAFPGMSGLDLAVEKGVAKGITFAVAAGNDNLLDACQKSPANAPNAITIGSTTSTDARSSFTNIGTCLDIFGPGSSITSATWLNDTGSRTISGTSMATPHVAGVAALYLQANPTATPLQVRNAIVGGATPGKVTGTIGASPNLLLYSLSPGNRAPAVDFAAAPPASTVEGATFAASASSSDADGDPVTYAWNMGDGSVKSGGAVSHKYADNGTYTVTVTGTDIAGATSTSTRTVVVANGSPVIRAINFPYPTFNSPAAGTSFNISARFDDPGANDGPFAFRVEWGDGAVNTGSVPTAGTYPLSHTYATPGTRTVTLRVWDKDGTSTAKSFPVNVQ